MAIRRAATHPTAAATTDTPAPKSNSEIAIARAAGLLPVVEATRGRNQEDDDELLLAMARLMLSPAPPKSISAAIAIVLDSFIQERKGPKKDWIVRLHGKRLLYKGVEQRLRDGYERDAAELHERLAGLEAFQARMERRIATVLERKAELRLSAGRLSSKQMDRLRTWTGDHLLMQDLDRCGDVIRSAAESAVKKKISSVG